MLIKITKANKVYKNSGLDQKSNQNYKFKVIV